MNLQIKLLARLSRLHRNDGGFTLIELLVVIIIIGILAAIALPSFLNQASKARQAEAKTTLGALNRAQQAFRLERQGFADEVEDLALGVKVDTANFRYGPEINAADADLGNFADPLNGDFSDYSQIFADAKDNDAVKTYLAAVSASSDPAGNAVTIIQICESNRPLDQADAQDPLIERVPDTSDSAAAADALNCINESIALGEAP